MTAQEKEMSIEVRKRGAVCVLELSGNLRYPEATALLRRTARRLIADGDRFLILNMLEVPFMDSSGIGEVVACYKRAREHEGIVKLVLQKPSYTLFTYTHLERMFEIFEEEEAAVASFGDPDAGEPDS